MKNSGNRQIFFLPFGIGKVFENVVDVHLEYSGDNDGELRYNPDSGNCEYYPDRLGGMESEEEFWEH